MKKHRKPLKPIKKPDQVKKQKVDMDAVANKAAKAKAKKDKKNNNNGNGNKRGYYVTNAMDVRRFLSKTLNECRTSVISDNKARALGYLCSITLKSLELGELNDRITKLEAILNAKTQA